MRVKRSNKGIKINARLDVSKISNFIFGKARFIANQKIVVEVGMLGNTSAVFIILRQLP